MRSPWCGSPETSSTRSLSRTPSMATTALRLRSVISSLTGATSISTTLGPAWSIGVLMSSFWPTSALRVAIVLPSRRTVTVAGSP